MTFIHFLTGNLLAFYLTYLLAFYLAYLLAFYLAYLLAFYLANLLAFYLAYLLAFYLAYLLAFYLAESGILSGISSDIVSDISSDILSGISSAFCLAYLLTFFLTFFLAFYLAYLLTFYLTSFLTFFPLRSGSAHCDLEVAVEVRQFPLRSGSCGWGPEVPTATWKSRLRSGSAHCDLQPAVEVRQCPLGSGARGGGPAVPTGIWTARRRRRVRRRRRRRRTALIKSNNPHLAGGEQSKTPRWQSSQALNPASCKYNQIQLTSMLCSESWPKVPQTSVSSVLGLVHSNVVVPFPLCGGLWPTEGLNLHGSSRNRWKQHNRCGKWKMEWQTLLSLCYFHSFNTLSPTNKTAVQDWGPNSSSSVLICSANGTTWAPERLGPSWAQGDQGGTLAVFRKRDQWNTWMHASGRYACLVPIQSQDVSQHWMAFPDNMEDFWVYKKYKPICWCDNRCVQMYVCKHKPGTVPFAALFQHWVSSSNLFQHSPALGKGLQNRQPSWQQRQTGMRRL